MSANLFAQLFAARDSLERPLVERPDGTVLTYRDTLEATARLAHRLQALGVKPGDRVAAQVERSVEALHLYLACLRVGGVYLPLNTAYTLPELEYFIDDAEPALVVCAPERRDALARFGGARVAVETLDGEGRGSLLEGVASQAARFDDIARNDDDLAAKGAMLTHRNLGSNAKALAETWRYSEDDRLIHAPRLPHARLSRSDAHGGTRSSCCEVRPRHG